MDEKNSLAATFEAQRPQLRAMAYRMLGSLAEAEDAVQEAWLKLAASEISGLDNPPAWLTTVVARVCLDMLRARKARREEPLEKGEVSPPRARSDPEQEAMLAEAVGLALMVVLTRLDPAERIAFVLHDMFALPFEDIAPIVERSTDAARQLASRARRRVRGADTQAAAAPKHRAVADAFLAASRSNDLKGLLAVLDPDVVFHADAATQRMKSPPEMRGAEEIAKMFAGRAQAARAALIDGALGVVVAPRGRLMMVLKLSIAGDRIAGIEAIADRATLEKMELAALT